MEFKVIAHIYNDFTSKFGIPRQSGIVDEIESVIVFEPKYRNPDALRGIEDFSHLWLIWEFSENADKCDWSPTVRPPKLGGNVRKGVFATRSPFRPNPLGLSCVKLIGVEMTEKIGAVLKVSGADLMNGTPIYDIKPYIPYSDSHPEASGGFALDGKSKALKVEMPEDVIKVFPERKRDSLRAILSQDPRPGYQHSSKRIYGVEFADCDIRFKVNGDKLTVVDVVKL